jgi:hypothetical protein
VPVTSPPTRTDDEETDDAGAVEATRPRSPWRLVAAVVVVGIVAMWAYVLYLALWPGRQPPVDRLEDPAFAEAAEARCAEAVAAIDELPPATAPDTAAERAAVIDQANAELDAMLGNLDRMTALAPAGDQRDRAEAWLTDWRTLLGNRVDYAGALRRDADARLLISEKGDTGRHVTGWIDEFALANRMESCVTPTDV